MLHEPTSVRAVVMTIRPFQITERRDEQSAEMMALLRFGNLGGAGVASSVGLSSFTGTVPSSSVFGRSGGGAAASVDASCASAAALVSSSTAAIDQLVFMDFP